MTIPRSSVLQGLLGVLLLAEGVPLSAERLSELVWADPVGETSKEAVHVGVSRLRKWLARISASTSTTVSVEHQDGYRLVLARDALDLSRFRALLEEASLAADEAERCQALASAIDLRRGPALAGMARLDRADKLLRSVENDIREAGMELATASLNTRQPQLALAGVQGLAEEHIFDEPLHAMLIDLLAASGRPAEAMRCYEGFSQRLAEELGVEPSGQVQEAYLRALAGDRPAVPQVTGVPIPAQLPPGIPDFAGRIEAVSQVVQSLGRPPHGVAISTISGMGGVGKTALAVHVAHLLAEAFPDGQLYTDLQGAGDSPADPREVLGQYLRALGISGSGIPASLEERAALFRSRITGRRLLIVLDNAASERQVRPLLPGSPGTAVLVTSRNRMSGLEGAALFDLGVFEAQEAIGLLADILGQRRVTAEPKAAAEIVRLCGHVPLAVRIAGARLVSRPHWTLSRFAAALLNERRRLNELTAGDLAVRTGFETSYRPLPAQAQRTFRLIGLLDPPDFAAWVVAALLDVPIDDAQTHLETLIDAQMVKSLGMDVTGQLRYGMHDLIRLYAKERALLEEDQGDREAALERALGGWLWLAEQAADHVPGPCYAAMHGTARRWPLPKGEAAAILDDPTRWFRSEHGALVAAVRQACELRLDEVAWDLAASLEKYFDVQGAYDDWRRGHELALRLCRSVGNRRGQAVLTRGMLEVTTWSSPNQSEAAMVRMRDQAERLLGMFADLDDSRGMADALMLATWGAVAQGAKEQALAMAERALRLSESADYPAGQARAYHLMAVAHGEADLEQAVANLERALEFTEQIGNPRFRATILQFLGAAHALSGNILVGHDLLTSSLAMARQLQDRYLETFSLVYLSKLYTALGDERARPTVQLALVHSHNGNFRHHLADALAILGELNLAEGDVPAAVACLEHSVRVWRTRGWLPFLAKTLRTLGDAHSAAGDRESAHAAWLEARDLFAQIADIAELEISEARLGLNIQDE